MPERVAIVHDYLNQRGGAERVALALARLWPDAPVYTTLYRPGSTFGEFADHEVRASPLNRVPVDRHFRALLPLYPAAVHGLGVVDADLVVSSSSGWAHAVRTRPDALHVCYCHTPARWLWDPASYTPSLRDRALLEPVLRRLRSWDRRAANRPTAYIANSARTAQAIERVYGYLAPVIPPPVRLDGLEPTAGGERLLVVSRLLPYKRVDLAVEAANRAGLPLDVVGVGPELEALKAKAKDNVVFHGAVDDTKLKALLEGCRMLLLPGVEDFGITPIEANAAGKPVVAFGAGGVLESQVEGVSAVFFTEASADALLDAITRAELLTSTPAERRANAERFGAEAFGERLRLEIERLRRGERVLPPRAAQRFVRAPAAEAEAAYAPSIAST